MTAVTDPSSSAYKIGPLDVLDISVFKVAELSKSVQVADGGTINLPLVGEVPAAGKTAQEVETDLTAKLGAKYLQSPQVTVFVKEYNSQRVTVDGAVKKPGFARHRFEYG
jgi:polysaccharide export outer membrane protein